MAPRRCTLILAAGQGTRMKSALPKVLHPVAGAPMVVWAIEAARAGGADEVVVVVGHGKDKVIDAVTARFGDGVRFAVQTEQRGTADAVRAGLSGVSDDVDEVVITYGDVPAVPGEALAKLAALRQRAGVPLALVTTTVDDPTGYGRIIHDAAGRVVAIREHKDCSPEERAITAVNPGLYAVDRRFLAEKLGAIGSSNAQGEFYLTDLIALAAEGAGVAELPWDAASLRGVNDRAELALVEALLYQRVADRHRRAGCTVSAGALIELDVTLAADCRVGAGVSLRGRTSVGAGTVVDVGCVLDDATIGAGALLKPYTIVSRSTVGDGAQLGPFAHIRPDSVIDAEAHVGNFVELKKTHLGPGAKANHLAYLGDGEVGPKANIGAGTIFCNYDGYRKHTTTIGAGAFVGSNSSLVAPVTIGENAYVGSGSVVTRDIPADGLGIGRARQENKDGYGAKIRARLQAEAAEAKKGKG
ncbi:MAG: bifunctional UDP-N-acetylglucosamine diphosphorylase/glucosamine-1-phosphate N-acetyltransferase GlmU [Polyangiales bacterium]